jgi:UDP-GlcNAc:undecaprenyl-phosphate/decaprenyl-phosphate GlcNAc-1-phosphate transferase
MGQVVIFFAAAFILSIVSAAFLTWIVREVSITHGWVVPPSSNRHVHLTPIPRLGGVAIYLTFAVVSCLCLIASQLFGPEDRVLDAGLLIALTVPATLLFLVGLIDDVFDIRPAVKLIFQVAAGLGLYLAGLHATDVHFVVLGTNFGAVIDLVATVFWVLAISNAVNIIDGLDGLAAGSTLFSIVTIFVMAIVSDKPLVGLVALVLAGSLIGFLKFNFHPASIFLGDSGSLFIGFMLSGLALAGRSDHYPAALTMAIPMVALGFPLVETAVSILRRFISGKKIFEADRAHIHHRLLELGLTQRQVVGVLYGFSAICALLSIVLMYPAPLSAAFVLTLMAFLIVACLRHLKYPEFREFRRIVSRTIDQRHIIVHSVAIRGASARLENAGDFEAIYQALVEGARATGMSSFELVVSGVVNRDSQRGIPIARSLNWSRSVAAFPVGEWGFIVKLFANSAEEIGLLRIHGHNEGSILFDFNVFFRELGPSLSRAVERAMIVEASRPRRSKAALHELAVGSYESANPKAFE